jgi:hypothetical protein
MTWPRNERCTVCTSPRPPQTEQVRVPVPGCAPDPEQVEQCTAVSTVSVSSPPNTAVARSMSSWTSASWPRWVRERGPRPPAAVPPKKASMMSVKVKPWPKPDVAPP